MPRAADPSRGDEMILEEYFAKLPRDISSINNCDHCGGDTRAIIRLEGYGDGQDGNCNWCYACAKKAAEILRSDFRKLDKGF
jgi:hypothetical protein